MPTTEIGISGSSTSCSARHRRASTARPSCRHRQARAIAALQARRRSRRSSARGPSSAPSPRPSRSAPSSSSQRLASASKRAGNGQSMTQRSPSSSRWAGTSMPTSSMKGTTSAIHAWRSSSLVMPLKPYSSWMPWRLRSSGRPNHSSVRMNIQSAAAWMRGLLDRIGAQLLDPRAPVAQVEGLLLVDLRQGALPGPERARPVHVGEQHEAGLVVERVGHHQLVPGVERHVEGVGVLEGRGARARR